MTLQRALFTLTLLLFVATAGCGKLATERAVLSAAKADSPSCPDEQMHVVGPVEVEGSDAVIYEVRVCDRERYYEDAAPEDGKREFARRKRPEGVEGNASLWAETDGLAPAAESEPAGSGGESDDFEL